MTNLRLKFYGKEKGSSACNVEQKSDVPHRRRLPFRNLLLIFQYPEEQVPFVKIYRRVKVCGTVKPGML